MKKGRMLTPEELHIGQTAWVSPSGPDVHRGVGLGAHGEGPTTVTDSLHSAARRGAVTLYEALPDEAAPVEEQ